MKNRVFGLVSKRSLLLVAAIVFSIAPVVSGQEESCRYCGMKKSMFEHSWVYIEHDDDAMEGFCSVHCAAIDMALHMDRPVRKVTVGDYDSKKQIDAEKAFWVIGGDRPGVMTSRAKWAFESKAAADKFMEEHGGRPAVFSEVMKAAFEDMYEDTLMIRKRRGKDKE